MTEFAGTPARSLAGAAVARTSLSRGHEGVAVILTEAPMPGGTMFRVFTDTSAPRSRYARGLTRYVATVDAADAAATAAGLIEHYRGLGFAA